MLYRATDRVSVWGSVSKGFRAPTLNELYRQFRVGAMLTLANEELGPERLTGVEAGVSVAATDRVTVRGTFFNNRVKDPIANVTTNAPTQSASAGIWAARTSAASRPTWRIGSTANSVSRRLCLRHRQSARVNAKRSGLRSDGEVSGGSAEAPRVVPGDVHQSALSESCRRKSVRRSPVRRRPERSA